MQSSKLAAASLISTAAFTALAVLGEGGLTPFFEHEALIALVAVNAALAIAAAFTSANLSPGKQEDRSNRWVLGAFGLLGLLSAWLPAYADRKDVWTIGGEGVRWAGVAACAAGGVLRLWPVFVLGKRFSGLVAIQPGHRLVTTGVYSLIRHPSYLGMLTYLVGWALAFRSTIGILLAALTVIPTVARIQSEEAMLRRQFGPEYEAYVRRTSRLIPGIY